jgi:hypothetical protein
VVRRRLGLVALGALILNGAWNLWDFLSRTIGLDPLLGAKRDTFWGHVLGVVLAPWFLLGIFVLFGLLWCFDPWWQRRFGKHQGTSETALRVALQMGKLPDSQKDGESNMPRTLLDAVPPTQEMRDNDERWKRVEPLVEMYKRARETSNKLLVFGAKMRAEKPRTKSDTGELLGVSEFMRALMIYTEACNQDFNAQLRPELVRLVSELRSKYGLLDSSLTDDKITGQISAADLTNMAKGLNEIIETLKQNIVDTAAS